MRNRRARSVLAALFSAGAGGGAGGANVALGAAAADNAGNSAYAAETGGAWKGEYVGIPADPEQNPPGTDNGGTGFLPWIFNGGYHIAASSPYGRTNHYIDGVDFAHSIYNDL